MRFCAGGLVAAVCWAGLAAAGAERPPLGPHSPVLVSYRIVNPEDTVPPRFTVLFAPDAKAARISFAGERGYMLVDAVRHRLTMVMDKSGISFTIPTPKLFAPYFEWRDTLSFTRGPRGFAAGRPCDFWIAHSDRGTGEICFTDDGVPLRILATGKKADRTDIEAVSLQPEPYDPSQFEVPADHSPLSLKGF